MRLGVLWLSSGVPGTLGRASWVQRQYEEEARVDERTGPSHHLIPRGGSLYLVKGLRRKKDGMGVGEYPESGFRGNISVCLLAAQSGLKARQCGGEQPTDTRKGGKAGCLKTMGTPAQMAVGSRREGGQSRVSPPRKTAMLTPSSPCLTLHL